MGCCLVAHYFGSLSLKISILTQLKIFTFLTLFPPRFLSSPLTLQWSYSLEDTQEYLYQKGIPLPIVLSYLLISASLPLVRNKASANFVIQMQNQVGAYQLLSLLAQIGLDTLGFKTASNPTTLGFTGVTLPRTCHNKEKKPVSQSEHHLLTLIDLFYTMLRFMESLFRFNFFHSFSSSFLSILQFFHSFDFFQYFD